MIDTALISEVMIILPSSSVTIRDIASCRFDSVKIPAEGLGQTVIPASDAEISSTAVAEELQTDPDDSSVPKLTFCSEATVALILLVIL
jgi:hypothetical protein